MRAQPFARVRHAWALALLPSLTLAGCGERPSSAPVGVLIGTADHVLPPQHDDKQHVTTTWIVISGDSAVATSVPTLLVPVRQRLNYVILTRDCDDKPEAERTCSDVIHVDTLSAAGLPDVPAAPGAGDPCTYDYKDVTFAGPVLFAVAEHAGHSDACEPRGWMWQDSRWVQRFDTDTLIDYARFGAVADSAFTRAWRTAPNVGAEDDASRAQGPSCRAVEDSVTAWGVRRERDRWAPVVFQQQITALCQLEAAVPWTLPDSVLGYHEPKVEWSNLPAGVEEAYPAPDGSWTLLATAQEIVLYVQRDRTLGRALWRRPRQHVVMVQWTSGPTVAAWSAAIAKAH